MTIPWQIRWLLFVPALATGGCAVIDKLSEGSPDSKIPPGSILRIEKPIPIPAGRPRIWLKGAEPSVALDSPRPVCSFEVWNIDREETQNLEPGELHIQRVESMWAEVVRGEKGSERALRLRLAGTGGDSDAPKIHEGYHLWFESSEQPNLMRVTCIGTYRDRWLAKSPTVAEIQAALGGYATLEIEGAGESTAEPAPEIQDPEQQVEPDDTKANDQPADQDQ